MIGGFPFLGLVGRLILCRLGGRYTKNKGCSSSFGNPYDSARIIEKFFSKGSYLFINFQSYCSLIRLTGVIRRAWWLPFETWAWMLQRSYSIFKMCELVGFWMVTSGQERSRLIFVSTGYSILGIFMYNSSGVIHAARVIIFSGNTTYNRHGSE